MKRYKFLYEWKEVRKKFIRPKFHWFIGKWRSEPNLPVWRRGNVINFGKYNERKNEWDYARLVSSKWTESGKKNHPIISKFLKPTYVLPYWMSCYFFNQDIIWKTREQDYDFRYEHPAHITFVIFSLCVSITAYISPLNADDWTCQDDYWESLLTYKYYNGDLKKTNTMMGWWGTPGTDSFKFRFQPRFLKNEEDRDALVIIQEKVYNKLLREKNI